MKTRGPESRKTCGKIMPSKTVAVALAVALVIVAVPPVWGAAPGGILSAPEAVGEAEGLVARVARETAVRPGEPGTLSSWNGVTIGTPLLVHSSNGSPSEYIVPVIDGSGKTISTIGVGAAGEGWLWYSSTYPHTDFPVMSAERARREVRTMLRGRGVGAEPPLPQARLQPDKLIYWVFELEGSPVGEAYIPAFLEGRPFTSLEPVPWEQRVSFQGGGGGGGSSEDGDGPAEVSSPGGAPPSYDIPGVPYHSQETNYWCGPACMEMVFDYWGPDIKQSEIAKVSNAVPNVGVYADEIERSAQFSDMSTAIQDPSLRGYTGRNYGYAAAANYFDSMGQLKELVAQNYPIQVLTWYDRPPSSGHFRVVKGYNDNLGTVIVDDPWYEGTPSGPDVSFNQDYFFNVLWVYSGQWGLMVSPLNVTVTKPSAANPGDVMEVGASIYYPGSVNMGGQFPCKNVTATIQMPASDYGLVQGDVAEQGIPDFPGTGSTGTADWRVVAYERKASTDDITVASNGYVSGSTSDYRSYTDRIGGVSAGTVVPPPPPNQNTRTWGHDSIGTTSPATTWFLAEGCTKAGFETWVLVQNPNSTAANVSLTYMTQTGPVAGPQVLLPANSRETFNVADSVKDNWEVSTMVTSDQPVVSERAMYGNGRTWGHDSIGVTTPATMWYLAEGCTKNPFKTWVLVQNPNGVPAGVSLTYMTQAGPVPGPQVSLPPNSRETFDVSDVVPDNWEVSTRVTSDQPVVAERAMYDKNYTWGHDSIGVTAPAQNWYLAEGCTKTGFETWVLVQNPGAVPANVTLTYMTKTGPVDGPRVSLAPNTRESFNAADVVNDNWDVSTKVVSDQPVVAERAMYGDGRIWGTDSVGVPAPATTWYLAEGCTKTGFQTWVLLQNPNNVSANVTITYMTPAGPVEGPKMTLDPDSRMSFNVADMANDNWEVSTKVESDQPVVAERSMYGNPW